MEIYNNSTNQLIRNKKIMEPRSNVFTNNYSPVKENYLNEKNI